MNEALTRDYGYVRTFTDPELDQELTSVKHTLANLTRYVEAIEAERDRRREEAVSTE